MLTDKLGKNIRVRLSLFIEAFCFYRLLICHNASMRTNKSIKKRQYLILRNSHIIEKGLSMRNTKKGFGKKKILELINELKEYNNDYNNDEFLIYPMDSIRAYIKYNQEHNANISEIINAFSELCTKGSNSESGRINSGMLTITRKDVMSKSNVDFYSFLKSRHSIRYFSDEVPDMNLINKALEMAQYTPSACNRQSWNAYIFSSEQSKQLACWQGGVRGFEQEFPCAILLTSNLNAFLYYEPHQAYVDGGLYAMTLLYSLHSLGLGTIPLSTGFRQKKIKALHENFNIPNNEVPIMIIGVGCMLDSFKIAVSKRKDYKSVVTYIK